MLENINNHEDSRRPAARHEEALRNLPDLASAAITPLPETQRHAYAAVPADFGAPGGTSISNKSTILRELDRFLGCERPPALEYIYVEPLANAHLPDGRASGMNPFGHAVMRYTISGSERVMNISGLAGHDMVNFFDPAEYLYGTGFAAGNEQKGVYNRTMIGLRIENLPDDHIRKLDDYYLSVRERQRNGDASFHLSLSRLVNAIKGILPMGLVEMGNCAAWTSSGLKKSGITDWRSYYPKRIFVKLLEETSASNPVENWNVVSYRRIEHAIRAVGTGDEIRGPVTPLHFLSSSKYRDLHSMDFVRATVFVPEGETAARIKSGGWKLGEAAS